MAELADAPDLGSGVHDVQVQVLLSAVLFFSCLSGARQEGEKGNGRKKDQVCLIRAVDEFLQYMPEDEVRH